MKLHCHRPSLTAAFQTVGGVVPTRTPKDILKNVKLQVSGNVATLTATDEQVGIRFDIPEVETDSQGETLLPTQRVIAILRELQEDNVELEVTEEAAIIRGGQSEFRLSVEDPAEFPNVASFEQEPHYSVPADILGRMIRRTTFATDSESSRYALGGVLLDFQDGKLTMAATDSRRLAVVSAACTNNGVEDPVQGSPVVPAKAMQLIERSLPDGDEPVRIAVRQNDVLVHSGQSTIYSRLVEGRFPRYQDVIPQRAEISIDLVVGPFYGAVRQSQIVTDEDSRGVDFEFSSGRITMVSSAANVGQSKVELPISFDGPDLSIRFDPRYISEFLRILDGGTQVTLQLIDGESPALFRTDDDYLYVIMPLQRER